MRPQRSPAALTGPPEVADLHVAQDASAREAVMAGNAQGVAAAPTLAPPGAPVTPFAEARLYAIVNVAMHDALNGIVPRYKRYADDGPVLPGAHPAVAVLKAARDAIAGAAPGATASVDEWYQASLQPFAGAAGLADGLAVGQRAAAAILARRSSDGSAGGGVAPYTPGTGPGDYRFTFPFDTPAFDFFGTGGFADASAWAQVVTPFVLRSASQFRAPRPYLAPDNATAVRSLWYARDLREVQRLGCAGCPQRTPEQTEIARFWVENSPTGWNRIARMVIEQAGLDAHARARTLALLQMGQFDAYTASLESKYHYRFWRPVSAIALADSDGNPLTEAEAGWQVEVFPTPPVPDYPSAHATAGGAAVAVLGAVIPRRIGEFAATSSSLPGTERRFTSLWQAARENADSRVYVGYHFRHATDVGLAQGVAVGAYVARHGLARSPAGAAAWKAPW